MLQNYAKLIRFDKPIGTLLLLWPTLWALWLAARGLPQLSILFIFLAGVFLMRSAGCVVNDIFDRNFDGKVARTRHRPLATGSVSVWQAAMFAAALMLTAFILVLFCNSLTIRFAFAGALFAVIYPLLKRVTHLPQVGLGIAFSWGVPMAFAAVTSEVPQSAWLLFATAAVWPVIYDTMYAMADRKDDLQIGVKSTAILFATYDIWIIAVLQLVFIFMLITVGWVFALKTVYFVAVLIAAALLVWQLHMIRHRDPQQCFAAFLHNNWVGAMVFLGILSGV